MKIKVCGMRDEKNILEILEEPPDYMGFIFYEKSSRFVGNLSPHVTELIPAYVGKTGVFVDASIEKVLENVKKYNLDFVQLHGKESTEYCLALKTKLIELNTGIIKVFSIGINFDFNQLHKYDAYVDYYLFDTKGKLPGGNGEVFNWEILLNYKGEKPFFLSGGIGPEHLEQIAKLDLKKLYAIDINSKFETAPALKDHIKTMDFVTGIRKLTQ